MRRGELTIEDDDGLELRVPSRWEICPRCEGDGTHGNPSIDGNGITAEEWDRDWDEESRDAYMSGAYDVSCEECKGSGKVQTPDLERCTPNVEKLLKERELSESEARAELMYWRKMESGGEF